MMHLSFQATQVSTILKSPNKILHVRGPESSSGEVSASSLPKPDSSLSYVEVTTNERYAIITERFVRTHVIITTHAQAV
jgi:hypothetical protein